MNSWAPDEADCAVPEAAAAAVAEEKDVKQHLKISDEH